MDVITQEQYNELRARYDRHTAFVDSLRKTSASCVSYMPDQVPADARITNEETAQIEMYEWVNNPPLAYFAYVTDKNQNDRVVTNFMGEVLGHITYWNAARGWRSTPSGGLYKFASFDMTGTNGIRYHGRAYPTSGDYVRLTAYKHQPSR